MSRPHKLMVNLTATERAELERGSRAGTWRARKVMRARVLLLIDISDGNKNKGRNNLEVAERTGCSKSTVWKLKSGFQEERLGVLDDKPRPGRKKIVDGELEAQMIALSCSEAPAGRERWTLRLLADKLVSLNEDLESLSYTTVGKVLKKMNLNLG